MTIEWNLIISDGLRGKGYDQSDVERRPIASFWLLYNWKWTPQEAITSVDLQ